MDLHWWLTFFASSWVIAISPGSGAVLSISHGMNHGVRQTSATILGLQLIWRQPLCWRLAMLGFWF